MKRVLFFYLCLAGLSACLVGQTLGDISGIVTDTSGAVVVNATVTATNTGTSASRETKTNDSGVFNFAALNPGAYDVKVVADGFKTSVRNGVTLEVQQSLRLDVELAVGDTSEAVEVSASAAQLSTENATVGTVIENKRIVDLPLNGRNALSLAQLSPNVSFGFPTAGQAGSRQGGIRADRSISIAGQRGQFNHYTLDGVENTDPNFNTYVVEPSVDSLQEFKVQTGIYPAEFGRGTAQLNISTKSGSNEFHGTAYEFVRNEKLDAKNYAFTSARPPKDPFKWNQFGFTLGGPVWVPKLFNGKNRLFFMTNYEWFRQRRNIQAIYTVPTVAQRNGDFSARLFGTSGIWDPATRPNPGASGGTQFLNNVIPTNRIDPVSRQLLAFLPTPNIPNALTNNYQTAQGRPINRDQFTGRFDFVESSNSQWFGRYSVGDENQLQEALSLNGDKIVTTFEQYMATNTRVLTPNMVNEFRFGFSQFYNTTGPELAFTRDVVGELNIPGLASGPPVQWGIPAVSFDRTYSGFGNGSEGPYENRNRSLQFIDNLSWTTGKHSFKFGAEIRNDVYRQVGNQFARGQFSFQANATRNPAVPDSGDGFADFLLGQPYQSEAAVSIANADFRANTFYFYVDDTWKLTNRLTLTLGLRYENTPPWTDQTGTLFNAIVPFEVHPTDFRNATAPREQWPFFQRQSPARDNCYEGVRVRWPNIDVRCDGRFGERLVGRDNNDWAPRVGLTWSPTSNWVIRTGGGMFYSQDTGNPRFDMARNLAGRLRDNSDTKYLTWQNSLASIAGGTANVLRPYTFANPYDRRTPYSLQYIFNVQRQLPFDTLFEIGYLGSVSRRLEALRSVNEALPAPRNSNLSVAQRSPFPNFGIIQLVDNGGKGNYNSLAMKVSKRFSRGLTYLASYTWSKSIDTSSSIRNQGNDTLFPQNSYCRQCERARSAFDTRHRFITSVLYELPVGRGKAVNLTNRLVNTLIGGWQIGSIVTVQSGFPLNIFQSGDPSYTGHTFDRPNATGIDPFANWESNIDGWWNPAAFSRTPDGTHGNMGRNTLTTPGAFSWDFSTLKDFNLTETHRLQFRFEAFNFPNHPVWGNPENNIQNANFGTIRSTRTNMRNLQFALKYIF